MHCALFKCFVSRLVCLCEHVGTLRLRGNGYKKLVNHVSGAAQILQICKCSITKENALEMDSYREMQRQASSYQKFPHMIAKHYKRSRCRTL
jgi:hypothetical protein